MVDPSSVCLKPGQLWVWDFTVGEDGFWPTNRVTSDARALIASSLHVVILHRGDLFTIVTLDQTGPIERYVTFDENGAQVAKRYHVVLLRDTLVWFEHSWIEVCKLVADCEVA